ncbi:prepilin-type N-terminal cleavage/methylation domain-containing protein [Bacillus sp. FJAT-28004]|uniref:prepilin-type N-terminal cleavage/methylation domain-containing protein n=1 Tax=Bacillus sp. FJAT-28004 TaxID=1679165 RepID=UPI0006B4BCB2|nr:prepilin-type N-terminal cleavage/methylation domain-containing protein [Bacillus sp. FJAT-28004]
MLMALKRNQKGLTLIELLAVLVIVGIIAAIAIPAIGGTISKSKTRADEASVDLIKEAMLRYVIDEETTGEKIVTIAELVSAGYLNSTVVWQNTATTFDSAKAVPHATNGTWTITVIDNTP